ncbi:MAG: TlpA disulfide reductase family protein [Bacteroidota bacterium]
MKRLFYFLLALPMIAVFMQCGSSGSTNVANIVGTQIDVNITNGENLKYFFDKILLNNTTNVISSGDLDKKGSASISIENPEHGIYRLRIGAKSAVFALNGSEKLVTLSADLSTLQNYNFEITGSSDAVIFRDFHKKAGAKVIDPAVVKSFVDTTSSLVTAMFATITRINPETDIQYHKNISQKFGNTFPGSPYQKDYQMIIAQVDAKLKLQRVKVGEVALDIDLPSPVGKNYKLSDLKGQVVLVDFWASWCRPCRYNNPLLVDLYSRYKDQGFTIYSVSLDKAGQKERWEKAIVDDKLTWPYHVSDLKGWACVPAKEYGVRGIPYTVLVDKEGKIAAINPKKNMIESELKKLL